MILYCVICLTSNMILFYSMVTYSAQYGAQAFLLRAPIRRARYLGHLYAKRRLQHSTRNAYVAVLTRPLGKH